MLRPHVCALTITFLAALTVAPGGLVAQVPSSTRPGDAFDPGAVDVMVVGAPHLTHREASDMPATELIRGGLARFEPDHVVVEWLHPSIDPATTNMYDPFDGLPMLARLWDYDAASVDSSLAHTRALLDEQKRLGLPAGATRIELGKLYYLSHDRLNAGYQWWIADRQGADVNDLRHLTRDNFEHHEFEIWGFPIAHEQGLEYITPFDYQGEDGAWIWMDIVMAVAAHALAVEHGIEQGDEGWDAAFEQYARGLEAWANEGDPTWFDRYADIEEVAEFAEVVRIWTERRATDPPMMGPPGLSEMRYNQSAAHTEEKRYMYDEVFPMISLDGLGQRLVDNFLLRNRRMIDFVEADVRRLGSTRVMIIVGESHRPFLEADLERRGYHIVPAAEFIP